MKRDELYHFGILGMHWGQHKETSKLDRVSNKSKKLGWSDDATDIAKIQTKKIKQMSNAELTKVNNRKNLEENYKRLNPNVIKKGMIAAGTIAAGMGLVLTIHSNGGKIIDLGKKTASNIMTKISKVKAKSVSKQFWNGMKDAKAMTNTNFSSLLN